MCDVTLLGNTSTPHTNCSPCSALGICTGPQVSAAAPAQDSQACNRSVLQATSCVPTQQALQQFTQASNHGDALPQLPATQTCMMPYLQALHAVYIQQHGMSCRAQHDHRHDGYATAHAGRTAIWVQRLQHRGQEEDPCMQKGHQQQHA
jgi:hypothetical protein